MTLEAPPALVPLLSVGISDVPGTLTCLGSDSLAYVSGRCVAIYSTDVSKVRVSEPCRDVRNITAMARSADHRWLAVAENMAGERPSQVALLDCSTPGLERRAILKGPGVDLYSNVEFSADGMMVVACSSVDNDRESIFHVWEWQTSSEPTSSGTVGGLATKVSINPKFPSNVVAQCLHNLAYLRLGTSGYRQHPIAGLNGQQGPHGPSFTDHTWMPDGRLVVALSDKRLLIMDGMQVTATVETQRPPSCLLPMPDGCLLVATVKGHLELFRPGDVHSGSTPQDLIPHASLHTPTGDGAGAQVAGVGSGDGSVLCMSLDSTGERVACYVRRAAVNMLNTLVAKTSAYAAGDALSREALWEEVIPAQHEAAVVAGSMAIRKDLVVTAGEDLTVRVWGLCPLRLVAAHLCHHSPLAVAMDPWGLELVVAYADCVRTYSIVEGMLLETGSLMVPPEPPKPASTPGNDNPNTFSAAPPSPATPQPANRAATSAQPQEMAKCSIMQYAPTGHLLAVVGGDGGKEIYIFNTMHWRLLARLKGHFTAIQDIAWGQDGLYLVSVGDGAVYTWSMETFARRQENTVRGFMNNSVAVTPDFSTIVVGDPSQGIRILGTSRMHAQPRKLPAAAVEESGSRGDGSADGKPVRVGGGWAKVMGKSGGSESADKKGGGSKAALMALGKVSALGATERVQQRTDAEKQFGGTGVEEGDSEAAPTGELISRSFYTGLIQPMRAGLVVAQGEGYGAILGAGLMGRVRVTSLQPQSVNHFQEYTMHMADVRMMVGHFRGRLVVTGDASGFWMLHALVAPAVFETMAKGSSPQTARGSLRMGASAAISEAEAAVAEGRGVGTPQLPPYPLLAPLAQKYYREGSRQNDAMDVLSVRAVDMHILKDSLREARDKLGKASTDSDYRVYERVQEVRRTVEGEMQRWRSQHAMVTQELMSAREQLATALAHAARDKEAQQAAHAVALEAERGKFRSRLAVEIERTNKAEAEVARLKAKFGKKLWQVEEAHQKEVSAAHDQTAALHVQLQGVQAATTATLDKALQRMDAEIGMDADLNEEELERAQVSAKTALEERDDRYMRLLAKHTLQSGISNKTATLNEELKRENEQLAKDASRLADQVAGLTEELGAMHAAWAERDVKQRLQDLEMKEMAHQVSQGRLYTQLATGRISEMSNEMEPLRAGKEAVEAEVAKLEALQMRQAERRMKTAQDHALLKAKFDQTAAELERVRVAAQQKEAYFNNFTTQLFRTAHNVSPDDWPLLFGRLYEDYMAGKDKLDWDKYLSNSTANAHSPAKPKGGQEAEGIEIKRTERELRDQIAELQAHVVHVEKIMQVTRETREKENLGHRGLVARLQQENVEVLADFNEARRDLKAARGLIDKLQVDLLTYRNAMVAAGVPPPPPPSWGGGGTSMSGRPSGSAAHARPGSSSTMHPDWAGALAGGGAGGAAGQQNGLYNIPESRTMSPTRTGDSGASNGAAGVGVGSPGSRPSGSSQRPRVGSAASTSVGYNLEGTSPSPRPGSSTAWTPPPLSSVGRPSTATGSVVTRPSTSSLQANTVTGDMPQGGWWMGENNLFEVPASFAGPQGSSSGAGAGANTPTQRPSTTTGRGKPPASPPSRASYAAGGARGVSAYNSVWGPSGLPPRSAVSSQGLAPSTPPPQGVFASPPRLFFSPPSSAFGGLRQGDVHMPLSCESAGAVAAFDAAAAEDSGDDGPGARASTAGSAGGGGSQERARRLSLSDTDQPATHSVPETFVPHTLRPSEPVEHHASADGSETGRAPVSDIRQAAASAVAAVDGPSRTYGSDTAPTHTTAAATRLTRSAGSEGPALRPTSLTTSGTPAGNLSVTAPALTVSSPTALLNSPSMQSSAGGVGSQLPNNYHLYTTSLAGSMRPVRSSRVATMGAGFRSYMPSAASSSTSTRSSTPNRGRR